MTLVLFHYFGKIKVLLLTSLTLWKKQTTVFELDAFCLYVCFIFLCTVVSIARGLAGAFEKRRYTFGLAEDAPVGAVSALIVEWPRLSSLVSAHRAYRNALWPAGRQRGTQAVWVEKGRGRGGEEEQSQYCDGPYTMVTLQRAVSPSYSFPQVSDWATEIT